jgi:acyl dehydratase
MLDDLTTPMELEGAILGPVTVDLTADRVAFYADTVGEDPTAWREQAPPGFGAVLLFAVADLFLYHPRVVPFTATLLHLDQSFSYPAPMRVGSTITMQGTITRVRERSGSFFVTFVAEGIDGDGTVVVGSRSTFVLSDQQAPAPEATIDEPPARYRADPVAGRRSASRHDLVRYAAATRDFNPLHWDHDVAVEAGLPGTVVHGLLMYAWMVQAAAAAAGSPVTEATVRFRSALHPGEAADVSAEVDGETVRLELSRQGAPLVTGTATVAATSR